MTVTTQTAAGKFSLIELVISSFKFFATNFLPIVVLVLLLSGPSRVLEFLARAAIDGEDPSLWWFALYVAARLVLGSLLLCLLTLWIVRKLSDSPTGLYQCWLDVKGAVL